MSVKININGQEHIISWEEFENLLLRKTPTTLLEVIDFIG
jgi:hypothetical protein